MAASLTCVISANILTNSSKSQNTQTNTQWRPKTQFFAPQNHWKWPFSGAKKWDFGRPNPKKDTTFYRQLYPKMVDETLVSYEIHFRASFGQILKIAYFRLNFGRFSLIKPQNQNPMVHSVNFWDKNLIFGIFVFLLTETARYNWVGHKNEFCFLRNTLMQNPSVLKNVLSYS